ncbi:hypothetical protein Nmel_012248 [Mimus melanotis]
MGGKQSTATRSRGPFPGVSTDDSAAERAPGGGGGGPGSDSTYAHGNSFQETGGGHHRDGMLYLGARASLADALPLHIAPRWFSSHSGECRLPRAFLWLPLPPWVPGAAVGAVHPGRESCPSLGPSSPSLPHHRRFLALETGKEAEEAFESKCCAEEEAEEELPASLTELGGQLGSLAGNMSTYGKGQGYPLHPPGWTLPCVLVSGEELWLCH